MTKPLREWVGWDGGPLIAIPAEIARHWRGIDPPPDASVPEGWIWGQPGGPSCDYDRACGVGEYSGVLDVGPGQAFILADGTMMTAFLPLPDGGMFVSWGHADSVREAQRAVSDVPDGLWQPTGEEWRMVGGPILVFTAAALGDSIPEGRGPKATSMSRSIAWRCRCPRAATGSSSPITGPTRKPGSSSIASCVGRRADPSPRPARPRPRREGPGYASHSTTHQ